MIQEHNRKGCRCAYIDHQVIHETIDAVVFVTDASHVLVTLSLHDIGTNDLLNILQVILTSVRQILLRRHADRDGISAISMST
jgi:hypothetical protein